MLDRVGQGLLGDSEEGELDVGRRPGRCLSAGQIDDGIGGVPLIDIKRIIVSCEGATCTAAGGAMRMDVVLQDGTTVEVARGGYGEFRQP